jgi:hypothetical protein
MGFGYPHQASHILAQAKYLYAKRALAHQMSDAASDGTLSLSHLILEKKPFQYLITIYADHRLISIVFP